MKTELQNTSSNSHKQIQNNTFSYHQYLYHNQYYHQSTTLNINTNHKHLTNLSIATLHHGCFVGHETDLLVTLLQVVVLARLAATHCKEQVVSFLRAIRNQSVLRAT